MTSQTRPKLKLSDSSGCNAAPPAVTAIGLVGDKVPCCTSSPVPEIDAVVTFETLDCPGVGALKPVLTVVLNFRLSVALHSAENLVLVVVPKVSKSSNLVARPKTKFSVTSPSKSR